eukprot:2233931-Rhodomonas_salina.2
MSSLDWTNRTKKHTLVPHSDQHQHPRLHPTAPTAVSSKDPRKNCRVTAPHSYQHQRARLHQHQYPRAHPSKLSTNTSDCTA